MASTRLDEVVILEHGGIDAKRLRVFDVQASWELSNIGAFSAYCQIEDVRAAGLPLSLKDRWLIWDHPTAGRWGGVISGVQFDQGVMEIAADSWGALLRFRILPQQERWNGAAPAALARHALMMLDANHGTFIRIGTIEEGGPPIEMVFGGQDVADDLLPSLVEAGMEWTIDEERYFHAGRKIGRDVSASVRLVEGVHIIKARIADDVWADGADETYFIESMEQSARQTVVRNATLTAVQQSDPSITLAAQPSPSGAPRKKQRTKPAPSSSAGSRTVAAWSNPIEHWTYFPPGVSAHSLLAPTEGGAPVPTSPIELTIRDVDFVWSRIQLGYVVRADIGGTGFSGRVRIVGRGIDIAGNTMSLSGEALADAEQAA